MVIGGIAGRERDSVRANISRLESRSALGGVFESRQFLGPSDWNEEIDVLWVGEYEH